MKPTVAFILQSFYLGGMETHTRNITRKLKDFYNFLFIATENNHFHPELSSIGQTIFIPTKHLLSSFPKNVDIVQFSNKVEYKDAAINAGVKKIIERTGGPRSLHVDKTGTDLVIASNKTSLPILRSYYSGKIELIYNGMDLSQKITRRRLFPEDCFVICYPAARVGEGQRHEDLIDAINIAKQTCKKIGLILICGQQQKNTQSEVLYAKIKNKIKNSDINCIFFDNIEYPLDIIAGSDVVIVPAKSHGISNSLIEGCFCSLPIISANVGAAREICSKNNGILYDSGNIKELSLAISKLASNKKLCIYMGREGRRLIESLFDIRLYLKTYRRIYSI